MFNEEIKDAMDDREIFAMISKAQEFEQLKVSFIISIYLINQQVLCMPEVSDSFGPICMVVHNHNLYFVVRIFTIINKVLIHGENG